MINLSLTRLPQNPCYSNWGVQHLLTFGQIPLHMTNSPSTSAREKTESSSMLDCVRRGCPTDETLCTLQQRVIQVSASDKFNELKESGQTPVCLFPTRKACDDLNNEMLTRLTSEVHEIVMKLQVHVNGTKKRLSI